MVTSHGEEKLVMEALTSGAKGYLLKPVTEDKLKTLLEKLVVVHVSDEIEAIEK
jgi:two-component system chemotaxis response regulator CheY